MPDIQLDTNKSYEQNRTKTSWDYLIAYMLVNLVTIQLPQKELIRSLLSRGFIKTIPTILGTKVLQVPYDYALNEANFDKLMAELDLKKYATTSEYDAGKLKGYYTVVVDDELKNFDCSPYDLDQHHQVKHDPQTKLCSFEEFEANHCSPDLTAKIPPYYEDELDIAGYDSHDNPDMDDEELDGFMDEDELTITHKNVKTKKQDKPVEPPITKNLTYDQAHQIAKDNKIQKRRKGPPIKPAPIKMPPPCPPQKPTLTSQQTCPLSYDLKEGIINLKQIMISNFEDILNFCLSPQGLELATEITLKQLNLADTPENRAMAQLIAADSQSNYQPSRKAKRKLKYITDLYIELDTWALGAELTKQKGENLSKYQVEEFQIILTKVENHIVRPQDRVKFLDTANNLRQLYQ